MAAPHSVFSQMLSTTLYNYVLGGKFADNIYDGLRAIQAIIDLGGKVELDGGESIVVQLEYAQNSTAAWMGPYGTLNTQPQDILTAAQFTWKQIAGVAIVTDEEQVKNSGKTAMANLAKIKLNNLMKSLRTQLATALMNAGTDSLQPAGLQAVIATSGTYGGISRSANAWWQANRENTAEQLALPKMRTMFNDCTHNVDRPNLIITTQTLYERYEALASSAETVNYPQNQGVADLGFEHLRFKGVPIIWDDLTPSGWVIFLNTDYFKIYCHKEWQFRPLPVQRPANQNLEVHPVSWFGAFATSNARMLGALTAKTA